MDVVGMSVRELIQELARIEDCGRVEERHWCAEAGCAGPQSRLFHQQSAITELRRRHEVVLRAGEEDEDELVPH
ncbi:hypothetical protein [Ornithinimicrobium sediminis]|uniref:hypothetical protein n=1 Tax=Ornithinimicrobium sediminis TaxID=2904603 RepID=UPI001E388EF5|nr:hypothetical protein [Ornithinimicrobium sediminis]MCE0487810.1 hypothetical protein [Ornithinimicrobium sediminis]